jgi:hypothetical protein
MRIDENAPTFLQLLLRLQTPEFALLNFLGQVASFDREPVLTLSYGWSEYFHNA